MAHPPESNQSLFAVLQRRSGIAIGTFAVGAALAFGYATIHKADYAAISHVALVSDPNGRDPTVMSIDMPTIATGSSVLLAVRKDLGLTQSVNDLRKAVVARIAPRSTLMTIAVQNKDPEQAIRINNAIADRFSTLYWRLAGSRYDQVTRRLDGDLERSRARLLTLNRRLEAAAAGASYVGSPASLDASAAHLGELQEQRGVTLGQYVTDGANLQADMAQPGKTAKVVRYETLRNNATYYQTESAVSKDVAQYVTTRAAVKATYPGITGFKDKVEKEGSALATLRTEALKSPDAFSPTFAAQAAQLTKDDAAVKGDRVKLAAFDEQIAALRFKLSSPAAGVPSIGALRAERDEAEARVLAISSALNNAVASSAQASSLGNVVVVDRATEARPTMLGAVALFCLGLFAAAVFAIAAVYVAELLLPRFLGAKDVNDVYGWPLLVTLRAAK